MHAPIHVRVEPRQRVLADGFPDDVFSQCNVQFRLASIQFIQDDSLANEIINEDEYLSPTIGAYRVGDYATDPNHQYRGNRDINVYLGGNGTASTATSQVAGFTIAVGSLSDVIMMTPRTARSFFGSAEITLAHELGHFVGRLRHTTTSGNDNLMLPNAGGTNLTAEQCERIRDNA